MPDPLISKLSEQIVADESTSAPHVAELAAAGVEPIAAQAQPRCAPQRGVVGSRPGRISRQYEASQLGISPILEGDTTLNLDMRFARPRPSQFSKHPVLAKFAGLEPLAPAPRKDDGSPDLDPSPSGARTVPTGVLPGIDTIPTLGPGIVWRLSEAGVRTMNDLARCDAAGLRKSLGQIGRLVKVEDWIAHARAVVSGQNPKSDA
jgi:hypothetical protein